MTDTNGVWFSGTTPAPALVPGPDEALDVRDENRAKCFKAHQRFGQDFARHAAGEADVRSHVSEVRGQQRSTFSLEQGDCRTQDLKSSTSRVVSRPGTTLLEVFSTWLA